MEIVNCKKLQVKQVFEVAELIGFETRNKYKILNDEDLSIGFAAERKGNLVSTVMRLFMGHWRKFDIDFFDINKVLVLKAHHPFRFFFQCFMIVDASDQFIGRVEQRFGIFSKKFDLVNPKGETLMTMNSPLFKFWTFPFNRNGDEIAVIKKKFGGILAEAFTDKDSFVIEFHREDLCEKDKYIILATSIFIDLIYFEKKAR